MEAAVVDWVLWIKFLCVAFILMSMSPALSDAPFYLYLDNVAFKLLCLTAIAGAAYVDVPLGILVAVLVSIVMINIHAQKLVASGGVAAVPSVGVVAPEPWQEAEAAPAPAPAPAAAAAAAAAAAVPSKTPSWMLSNIVDAKKKPSMPWDGAHDGAEAYAPVAAIAAF